MSDRDLVEEYYATLRDDFLAFSVRSFAELNPGEALVLGDHLEVMASRLDDVHVGRTRRLIINVPPRSLKSLMGSVFFPAWLLGHDPTSKTICASYSLDLADKHARDTRTLMSSEFYRQLFPGTRLASPKPALQELITTAGGYRLATSIGGVLTGRGANTIIIDDPQKPTEALSQSQREAVNEWYDHTLLSRLDDKRTGGIVLIMQRLHEEDLTGHVLERDRWEHVRFAAIAEEDEEHRYLTPAGPRVFRRKKGDLLQPEREPRGVLENLRRTLGNYAFAGQYQQMPVPQGGGLIKIEWLKRYKAEERPEHFDRIVQSWDTANKASELSDYSVCTTWGIKGTCNYLLHVFRERLEFPDLKRAVRRQQQLFSANVVLIEDKASGTQLIQELNRDGLSAVTRYRPECDKVMRMHSQSAAIEDGRVLLPKEAAWLDDYLHELTMFPRGKHDDQVDSTAQFLDWLSMPFPGQGAYEYARRQAEREQHPERFRVRVQLPPGPRIGQVQARSGVTLNIDPDRTVEMSEDDAKPLIAAGWTEVGRWQVDEA